MRKTQHNGQRGADFARTFAPVSLEERENPQATDERGTGAAIPNSSAPAAIQIYDLSKIYGRRKKRVLAVDHLSLEVRQGEVFGLLGPNGSGKTTVINMISGLIRPTAGEIHILGNDIRRDIHTIRARLGSVPQETALYDELTAWANMDFHADLYGVPGAEKRQRITGMLELVQLLDRKDSRVGTFSGGMKRRLAIARALLHDPQLMYLDEPTLGVDVQARAAIWNYIRVLRTQGKTVLITTNYLEEAQALCDRLAIIDHGTIVAVDTPDHLREAYGGSVITLDVPAIGARGDVDLDPLRKLAGVTEVSLAQRAVTVVTQGGANNPLAAVVNHLSQQGEITDIKVRESSLDEVFLHLTGTALRD